MANDGTVRIGTLLDDSGFKSGLSKLGSVASGALKGTVAVVGSVATAAAGAVAGLLALEESTEEYRIAQGKLNAAYEAAGSDANMAAYAYGEFYKILGDTDTATEASQLLSKLSTDGEDIAYWTHIAAGVFGEFGDSLPIEGLIEASNETAKTAKVTGVLADALNWVGLSEDEVNKKLASMSDETERADYLMNLLMDTYDESADAFWKNNEALTASREAQIQMDNALANLGTAVSDVKTRMTGEFLPAISQITEGLAGMLSGTEGAEQQFSDGIGSLITTAVSKLPEFLNFGTQILTALLQGIIQNLPTVVSAIPQVILSIISALQTMWPTVSAAGSEILGMLIDGIFEYVPVMLERLPEIIVSFLDYFYSAQSDLIETGFSILEFLADGIVEAIPGFIEKLPEVIESFLEFWSDNLDVFLEKGIEILETLALGIIDAIPLLLEKLPEIITTFVSFVSENLPKIVEAGVELISSLISGLIQAIPDIVESLPEIITAIVEGIGALNYAILEAGANIVEGLWEGISSMTSWVYEKVSGFVSGIVDDVKGLLGIHSPSKVFQDEVGKNIGLGVAKGIEDSEDDAVKSAKELAESVYDQSKEWIDKQAKYQGYSLKEQLEVWEAIQDQFISESQQYADAEEEIFDLRTQIQDEYYSKVKEITQNISDLQKEYQNELTDRTQEIFDTFGIFDEIPERQEVSGEQLISNLENQVALMEEFYSKLDELSARGVNAGIVESIRDMGPDAISELDALLALEDEKLSEFSDLYEEKQQFANEQAIKELEPLKEETLAQISENLDDLSALYEENAPYIGETFAESLAKSIEDGQEIVSSAAATVAKNAVLAAQEEMAKIIPYASASVSASNYAMAPSNVSATRFSTETAISNAAGMMAMAANLSGSREVVFQVNGTEFARAIIPDLRAVESQSPAIVSD